MGIKTLLALSVIKYSIQALSLYECFVIICILRQKSYQNFEYKLTRLT